MGEIAKQFLFRITQGMFIALGVSTIIFAILVSMPGDLAMKVALARYGEDNLNRERIELVRHETGLDDSVLKLYFTWVQGVFTFDLGHSMVTGEPVSKIISFHLWMSFLLGITGLAISILIALPIGIWSGLNPDKSVDFISAAFSSLVVSVPSFVLGAVLIIIFSVHLKWLPAAGFFSVQSIILPGVTLGIVLAAVSCRVIRTSVVEVKSSFFLLFAQLKGLSKTTVFFRHGLRNGAVPIVTFLALQLAHVLDGVVVLENLFNWPGVGMLLMESIQGRDLSVIQGVTMIIGFVYVGMNLIADLVCAWLDPRQLSALRTNI